MAPRKDELIRLWADVASEEYWAELVRQAESAFVPFTDRWPQPGFVGQRYFESKSAVLLMGQNPRASNTASASQSDRKLFSLIMNHAKVRSEVSLNALFEMQARFMEGTHGYRPAWRPISLAKQHLGLDLQCIAYLNLIPLATRGDRIHDDLFRRAFDLSTKRQLELLQPAKIVLYGKGAYERFRQFSDHTDVRYVEQRNFSLAPRVKSWLADAR